MLPKCYLIVGLSAKTGHFHIFSLMMKSPVNHRGLFMLYLTNRFHVAVRLFSNRSQMTSKCGKNKKVAHEA